MTRSEVDEPQGGLPKNFIRPCLLLLVKEQPSHGYDLLERLDALGMKRIDPGGLYRALRAMEQEGLVDSSWKPSEVGPPRRTYRLTEEGEDWLHAWAGTLKESRRILDQYLRRYDALLEDLLPSRRG
ncbi:helix-turn-helix transcriptional regulator [soil metagenome]